MDLNQPVPSSWASLQGDDAELDQSVPLTKTLTKEKGSNTDSSGLECFRASDSMTRDGELDVTQRPGQGVFPLSYNPYIKVGVFYAQWPGLSLLSYAPQYSSSLEHV